jgi:hypothetical protein
MSQAEVDNSVDILFMGLASVLVFSHCEMDESFTLSSERHLILEMDWYKLVSPSS